MHRRLHLRVAPVEVGLLGEERVQVVLAGGLVERPGRTAEQRLPVVGRAAVRRGIPPHVPVPPRTRPGRSGIDEPVVPIGRVVRHEVDEHPDVPLVTGGEEPVEVGQIPVDGVDVGVVRHVVAEVGLGRREEGAEPDRVDPEGVDQVVEPGRHPLEIADPVPVAVRPRPRVDLVDHAGVPPAWIGRRRHAPSVSNGSRSAPTEASRRGAGPGRPPGPRRRPSRRSPRRRTPPRGGRGRGRPGRRR